MTARDVIPEAWLARRVQVRLIAPSRLGDRLWGVTCPGCTLAARIYGPLAAVADAATKHAAQCRPLHLHSFSLCPRCGGTGEIPVQDLFYRPCGACLGRGHVRWDQGVAA